MNWKLTVSAVVLLTLAIWTVAYNSKRVRLREEESKVQHQSAFPDSASQKAVEPPIPVKLDPGTITTKKSPSPPPASTDGIPAALKKMRKADPEGLVFKEFKFDGRYLQVTVDDVWYALPQYKKERLVESIHSQWWEASHDPDSWVKFKDVYVVKPKWTAVSVI